MTHVTHVTHVTPVTLQADQWKIYPTQVVPWTVIKRWFENGEYTPYPMDLLFELLMQVASPPWRQQ